MTKIAPYESPVKNLSLPITLAHGLPSGAYARDLGPFAEILFLFPTFLPKSPNYYRNIEYKVVLFNTKVQIRMLDGGWRLRLSDRPRVCVTLHDSMNAERARQS